MARFKFKLETVLKVKTRVEDLRKRALQMAEVKRQQAKNELLQRQNAVQDTIQTYRQSCQQKLDLFQATNYHKFLIWQNKQVELANQSLKFCENKVVQTREQLLEASKEKKTVEKLKEKALVAYKAEELNREIQFLDELGTGRFTRNSENKEDSQL
ncbi:MAG TPA: flagellar export protein FliJ [Firmicutes bacterium]|jgi:flagellar protein FliJ|nr:flagellar export protein FliJ [Bacillota bacterium]